MGHAGPSKEGLAAAKTSAHRAEGTRRRLIKWRCQDTKRIEMETGQTGTHSRLRRRSWRAIAAPQAAPTGGGPAPPCTQPNRKQRIENTSSTQGWCFGGDEGTRKIATMRDAASCSTHATGQRRAGSIQAQLQAKASNRKGPHLVLADLAVQRGQNLVIDQARLDAEATAAHTNGSDHAWKRARVIRQQFGPRILNQEAVPHATQALLVQKLLHLRQRFLRNTQ